MRSLRPPLLVAASILVAVFGTSAAEESFVAYSLKEGERRLKEARGVPTEVEQFGGITRFAGMVYDAAEGDVIFVGQSRKGDKAVTLNHFVVALRALLIHKAWPLVSIDKTVDTPRTGTQTVRFEGGIASTEFGRELFDADVTLKKLALDVLPTEVWGVQSYFRMAANRVEQNQTDEVIGARFWFDPIDPALATRFGVFALKGLRVGVRTEITNAVVKGRAVKDMSTIRDAVGDDFAAGMTAHYNDLTRYYPEIGRVKALYDVVALAHGVGSLSPGPDLSYWLNSYQVKAAETPAEYPLIKRQERKALNGTPKVIESEGGVELRAILLRLRDGDVTALRDAVLKSRPRSRALTWSVPLQGWHIPGTSEENDGQTEKAPPSASDERIGTYVGREIRTVGNGGESVGLLPMTVPPSPPVYRMPRVEVGSGLLPQRFSPNVGGVMLSGVARVGDGPAKVDLTDGNFSLVVNGDNARLDPQMFRKFVTALWTVYFGRQDPGISIDPIYVDPQTGGFSEKHLVRYIGRVVNTDLGRVMREADYQMKKWSVGTERADVPGFKSPDQIAGRSGTRYLSLSRFWLVPEDMRFKSTNNMLLFDSGRMTVKTEVLGTSEDEKRADPHNERFARFFTDHYEEISKKHPIYQELLDYAKLVALAKYLEESGVPLFWFLMANKDLVLTEDSPGTVDNLAKGSDYWKGLTIQGGVDLATKGRYVFDAVALKAVNDAVDKLGTRSQASTSLTSSRPQTVAMPFSFGLGPEKYSVAPQHTLSAGKDRHGILYQTDIALRAEGYIVTPDLIDSLGAEMIRQKARRILVPAIEKMPEAELRVKLDALIAPAMEMARQQVEPVLASLSSLKNREFKTEAECIRAWDDAVGRWDVAEWKAYFVKQAHYATNLELVRYFNPGMQEGGEFGRGWRLLIPYRVRPADKTPVTFQNVALPRQVEVENLLTGEREALTFSTDRYAVAGYVPDRLASSGFVGLFLLSDGSFRLVDKVGSEFQFDQAGYLTDLMLSEDHRVQIEYADERIETFNRKPYSIEAAGEEKVDFLNATIPTKIKVTDLIHNVAEVLTFSRAGEIAGYVPENAATSRFKILALLSDASFELLDANGNTVSFDPSGGFEGVRTSADARTVKSIRMGHHMVSFSHTIDARGRVVIAASWLSKDTERTEATHVVRYEYDGEGRLTRVDKSATASGVPIGNSMAPGALRSTKLTPAVAGIQQ